MIVDDHELVRRGICTVLSADVSIEICGEAFDGQEAVEKAVVLRSDAVVMDISMPRMNGLEATREIKRLLPETEIVIVSQYEVPEMVRQATNAGARAYVSKSAISSELLDVLARIRKRDPFVQVVGLTDEDPYLDAQQILQQSAAFEKALRESEERFRAIVETTPECVKLVAADGTLVQMNSSGLKMVGADSSEKVVGKNVYDIIAPHHRAMYREFNERICGGEKGSLEFDIVGLKGAYHHMETHAAPLRMPDGTTVHLAVTRDITERTRAEREILESEQRLRALADGLESQVHLRTQELEERNEEVSTSPNNCANCRIGCCSARTKNAGELPATILQRWNETAMWALWTRNLRVPQSRISSRRSLSLQIFPIRKCHSEMRSFLEQPSATERPTTRLPRLVHSDSF